MLKKIALVLLLALPMGVFAQNLKFGHINAQEIVSAMPEFAKAQSDIEALDKQLTSELQRTQEEFNKKYAIKAVGAAEGVIYIFDLARTPVAYVNESQSINLTPKVKTQLGIK